PIWGGNAAARKDRRGRRSNRGTSHTSRSERRSVPVADRRSSRSRISFLQRHARHWPAVLRNALPARLRASGDARAKEKRRLSPARVGGVEMILARVPARAIGEC